MSTTPPPSDSSAVSFQQHSGHSHSTTSNSLSPTPKYDERNSTFQRLARQMGPYFVGPMPVDDFFESFMPVRAPSPSAGAPQSTDDIFRDYFLVQSSQSEKKWHDVFNNAINRHLNNLVLINTSSSRGLINTSFPLDLEPDCSVYTKDAKPEKAIFDFNHVDFVIDFKNTVDPFVELVSMSKSEEKPGPEPNSNPFLNLGGKRDEALGQLTAYATAILSAQYRTHLFTILIVNAYARLIRWDRSGAVVTEPIHFDKDGRLIDFLMRYDSASRKVRGHDSTVSVPSKDEIECAKKSVPEWDDKTDAFLTIMVPHKDTENRFIIPCPEARPDIPVGRWTRSSIAYDIQMDRRVYLKDSWRVLMEGIESEGAIYHRLHEGNVPNIPPCLSASDIGDEAHHRTQTQLQVSKEQGTHSYRKLTPYRHYRIVLGVVGRKLKDFTHSREMVSAMHAALKAHKVACDLHVLHGDISDGNILIVGPEELRDYDSAHVEGPKPEIEGGMLIDWDLSKIMDPNEPCSAPQFSHTGTWEFMAGDITRSSTVQQTSVHDLESFFWVLLWMVLMQMDTSWDRAERSSFMDTYFNPKLYKDSRGCLVGGFMKEQFMTSERLGSLIPGEVDKHDLQIPGNLTLTKFLYELKDTVSTRYKRIPTQQGLSDEDYKTVVKLYKMNEKKDPENLKDKHFKMLGQFADVLSKNWPDGDKTSPQTLQPSIISEYYYYTYQFGTKRPRSACEAATHASSSRKRLHD